MTRDREHRRPALQALEKRPRAGREVIVAGLLQEAGQVARAVPLLDGGQRGCAVEAEAVTATHAEGRKKRFVARVESAGVSHNVEIRENPDAACRWSDCRLVAVVEAETEGAEPSEADARESVIFRPSAAGVPAQDGRGNGGGEIRFAGCPRHPQGLGEPPERFAVVPLLECRAEGRWPGI